MDGWRDGWMEEWRNGGRKGHWKYAPPLRPSIPHRLPRRPPRADWPPQAPPASPPSFAGGRLRPRSRSIAARLRAAGSRAFPLRASQARQSSSPSAPPPAESPHPRLSASSTFAKIEKKKSEKIQAKKEVKTTPSQNSGWSCALPHRSRGQVSVGFH